MAEINTDFYPKQQPNSLLGTIGQAAQIQGGQIANQQAHQDLVQKQVQYLAGGLGILAKKPDLSQDDMMGFAHSALAEGTISPETFKVEAANVAAAGNDPVKLQALATNYAQRALDAGSQFTSTFGAPTSVNTGPNTLMGTLSPLHGFTPQASVANALSPSEAATPTKVPTLDANGNPTGGETLTTLGNFAGSVGGNPLTGAPAGNPANPLTGGAPVPLAQPAGRPTAMPGIPSATPQQQTMFTASTQQYQDAKANDANYTANQLPLQKSLELLPNTPLFGKGAEIPTTIAQVFNTFGIPIGSDQSKNASELDKYLTQIGRSSGAAPNSDAQLLAAFSANPNMSTDKAAAQDVIKTMLALQRMQHAAVTSAQQQGMDASPQNYSTYASKWGAQQDPRAYGVDLMTPEAKVALLKQLSADPAAKAKFVNSLRTAAQVGVLGQPGAASGQ